MKIDLEKIIGEIQTICRQLQVPLIFMGGIAVSVWAKPRATYDIDGILKIEESKLNLFLKRLAKHGFRYDRKKPLRQIQGFPFITLKKGKIFVDLFIAVSEYQKQALKRKRTITLGRKKILVVSPEDLILHKLLSGRNRDLEDVREILISRRRLNWRYLNIWAERLGIKIFLEDEMKSLGKNKRFGRRGLPVQDHEDPSGSEGQIF